MDGIVVSDIVSPIANVDWSRDKLRLVRLFSVLRWHPGKATSGLRRF